MLRLLPFLMLLTACPVEEQDASPAPDATEATEATEAQDFASDYAEALCAASCESCDPAAQAALIGALCPEPAPELVEGCLAEVEALAEGEACELAPNLPACDAACGG